MGTDSNFVNLEDYKLSDIAFIEDINGVWKTVVVLDKATTFAPLNSIYIVAGLLLLLAAGILLIHCFV